MILNAKGIYWNIDPLQSSVEVLHLRQVEPLDACIFALVSIANVSTSVRGEVKFEL